MPRINSTWLIGSLERFQGVPITFDGQLTEHDAEPYYLVHAAPSLSLLHLIDVGLTAAGVPGVDVGLLENRRVRITADAPFSIVWGAGTQYRDMLGFDDNLDGADEYIAPNISPLLWSAGDTVNREVIPGVAGYEVEDITITVSADGSRQFVDHHTTHVWDTWKWPNVYVERYDSQDGLGGTWMAFRRHVARHGHRVQMYELVEEDATSTAPVSLPAPAGTYRIRKLPPAKGKRTIKAANVYWGVKLDVRRAPEYA